MSIFSWSLSSFPYFTTQIAFYLQKSLRKTNCKPILQETLVYGQLQLNTKRFVAACMQAMTSPFLSLLSLLYVVHGDDVEEGEIYYRGNDLVVDATSGNVVIRHNSGNETSLHDLQQELQATRNQISSILPANCNDVIEKGLWLNVSSGDCILSLPSCSGDGEVIAWQQTTRTFSCSSNPNHQILSLQSRVTTARSQLESLRSEAASSYACLQGFIACQREGMSYNVTLHVCVPMVPECTRDGKILVWNAG